LCTDGEPQRLAPNVVHCQLGHVVARLGRPRLVREVEYRELDLHRIGRCLVDGPHVFAVDEELDPSGLPVGGVDVERADVEL
jgi:hypothetical protein